VSRVKALNSYGVYFDENLEVDEEETETVRAQMRVDRGTLESFNFGNREKVYV